MALKQITGKDIKEAVDWLWKHKEDGGCIHHVLGTTDDGTKLCFVVGWANGRDYGDDDKKYGYFDEGYCISAKIAYQHRNNAMQSDYEWDFNMPYDTETGDVWDTSSYVPRDADWEREAADYNKEAQKIWDAYCIPNEDGTAPIDLMESKKKEAKKHACSMQKKKESLEVKAPAKCSMQKRIESFQQKEALVGTDSLKGITDVSELEKKLRSMGFTFVESGDYVGLVWGYAVYKSPRGEYVQFDFNANNDRCRNVKVYTSKQDFMDAEHYDPDKAGGTSSGTYVPSESKKSEADYRASKPVADAYKVLDDYYCDKDGSLRKDAFEPIMIEFRNDRDLYDRSKSSHVTSTSLAWDAFVRTLNAYLEWDDETPHATKLSSAQVKNWFSSKGKDFKEELKPLVDAIDKQREEWWGK